MTHYQNRNEREKRLYSSRSFPDPHQGYAVRDDEPGTGSSRYRPKLYQAAEQHESEDREGNEEGPESRQEHPTLRVILDTFPASEAKVTTILKWIDRTSNDGPEDSQPGQTSFGATVSPVPLTAPSVCPPLDRPVQSSDRLGTNRWRWKGIATRVPFRSSDRVSKYPSRRPSVTQRSTTNHRHLSLNRALNSYHAGTGETSWTATGNTTQMFAGASAIDLVTGRHQGRTDETLGPATPLQYPAHVQTDGPISRPSETGHWQQEQWHSHS